MPRERVALGSQWHKMLDSQAVYRELQRPGVRNRAARALQQRLGGARCLLTGAATHALDVIALSLEISPKAEVIVPSFTFPSSANAFAMRGAAIQFCDIDPQTLCMDTDHLETLVGPRTKAIIAVHYGGNPCDLETIAALAARAGAVVIEDAAHGFGSTHGGRPLGTIGDFGVVSFQATKGVSCGEGGALILPENPDLSRAIEPMLTKGVDRDSFERGEVAYYQWASLGSHYAMSDLHAAVLLTQLSAAEERRARREATWREYQMALTDWATVNGFVLPARPAEQHSAEIFYVVAPDRQTVSAFAAHMDRSGVATASHYRPLHLSPMGRRLGGAAGECPVTEHIADCLLRLPVHEFLSSADRDRVIEAVLRF